MFGVVKTKTGVKKRHKEATCHWGFLSLVGPGFYVLMFQHLLLVAAPCLTEDNIRKLQPCVESVVALWFVVELIPILHSGGLSYIQGVTGGTDQTSGECSLGQTIQI